MKRLGVLVVMLLTLSVLAGCIQGEDPADSGGDLPVETGWLLHEDLPWPSGQVARDYIESYVMTHPYRLNSAATQDFMDAGRDGIEAILVSHNISVVRHDYGSGVNMLGIIEGTKNPDQWVVLSAHYDTTESTVYGAWDDGTGVGSLFALGEILVDWELPFTVVLAFFDEEEQGLIGSRHFVADYNDEDSGVELVANINMDPPGLNWPCGDATGPFPVKIIHDMGKVEDEGLPRYAWLYEAMEHALEATGVPESARDYTPGIPIATVAGVGLTGTSDHANFNAQNIANVYLGGTPTTAVDPVVAALTYPLHTPLDTLEAVEARCTGGEGTLADGLQTTVSVVSYILGFMGESGIPEDF
jgi:hypothetical protein